MTLPEWTKPGIYGAIIGAVGLAIVGFNWGGWTTSGAAEQMAQNRADEAVTTAMVPICLSASKADPEREAKLATINQATRFKRRDAVMDAGWANLPGAETPDRDLAEACMEDLGLDPT
ncbi:hypothetical protein [Planktotalea sp.]|uniref:hypothetical protein n=1 Tax=Planktotalea sp. TaxID=2029877 RepID=UPI0035C87214